MPLAAKSSRPDDGYTGFSMVLETEFETASGAVRLIDFMPVRRTEPDLVRVVEGLRGDVEMELELVIRFDYGLIVPWVRKHDGMLQAIGGPDAVALWSPVDTHGDGPITRATFTIRAGDQIPFVLAWFPSHASPPAPLDPIAAIGDTQEWWEEWCAKCTSRRTVSTAGAPLLDGFEKSDVRSNRRHRCGADDVVARTNRWGAELGLSLLLD